MENGLVRSGVFVAAILAVVLGLLGVVSADNWSQYGHDANHSGTNGDPTILSTAKAASLGVRWTFSTGGTIAGSAAIVDDSLYVGSWDGNLYALDAETGKLKWKTFLGVTDVTTLCGHVAYGVSSGPAVANGVVYVGGGDSYFYAVDATTGAVRWRVFTGDNSVASGHYNWSSPSLLGNGLAFLGVASLTDCPLVPGQVFAIDLNQHSIAATANLVANGQAGAGVWSSAASLPTGGAVFITTGNSNSNISQSLASSILSLSWKDLAVTDAWQVPSSLVDGDSDWGTSPVPFQTRGGSWRVGAISKNGNFYALDAGNLGKGPVWQTRVARGGPEPGNGDGSVSTPAYNGSTIFMAGGNTTIGGTSFTSSVQAVNPDDGSIIWQQGTNRGLILGALAANPTLLVDGAGSALEVRDQTTGQILYSYAMGAPIFAGASFANDMIYASSSDGTIYAFGLPPTPAPLHPCPTSVPTPFPTVVAPAFTAMGQNTVGLTSDTQIVNRIQGVSAIAPNDGQMTSLRVFLPFVDGSKNLLSAAIYTDEADAPGQLLWNSSSLAVTSPGWQTLAVPGLPVAAGETYWLLFNVNGPGTAGVWTGDSSLGWIGGLDFGSWPDAHPSGGHTAQQYSIAATIGSGSSSTSSIMLRPSVRVATSPGSYLIRLPLIPVDVTACS